MFINQVLFINLASSSPTEQTIQSYKIPEFTVDKRLAQKQDDLWYQKNPETNYVIIHPVTFLIFWDVAMMGIVSNNNQKYKTLTYVSFIGKSCGFVLFAPVNQDIVQPKRLEIHIINLL